jgi:SOS response regulatory protein OraA/RecX
LIATVIAELEGDPQGRAEEVARERATRAGGLEPATAFARLSGFLMRRGYEPALARSVARRALAPGDPSADD